MNQRPGNQLFDAYFTARDMREVFCDQGRVQASGIGPGRSTGRYDSVECCRAD